MTDEKHDLMSKIETSFEKIRTREDLVAFVDLLAEGVEHGIFDEQAIINYIHGIALVLEGVGDEGPEDPDWQFFARVLLSAFFR